jgi:predicted PurR-regulated permease PerM
MTDTPRQPEPDRREGKMALAALFADEDAERVALQRVFILVLAISITAVFVWMVKDFLGAVFLAIVLAIFLMPVQNSLSRSMGGRPRIAASLTLLLALLIFLVPMPILAGIIAEQAVQVTEDLGPWLREQVNTLQSDGVDALPAWLPFRESLAPYQAEITAQLGNLASSVGGIVMNGIARIGGSTLSIFLNLIVLLFALFYFLVAGQKAARRCLHLLPLPQKDRKLLADRALSTIRAVVKGTFVIGVIQGTVTGFSLAVAGVPGAAFWGLIAGLLSIIPGIGTPLVWGPAAAWLLATGEVIPGIALAVWGFIVIMNIDNLLRPWLVGRDAKLNDLMVLISTLGGLVMFGAIGLIIGPVIAALMSSVWYLYARAYAPFLNESPMVMAGGGMAGPPKPPPSPEKPET